MKENNNDLAECVNVSFLCFWDQQNRTNHVCVLMHWCFWKLVKTIRFSRWDSLAHNVCSMCRRKPNNTCNVYNFILLFIFLDPPAWDEFWETWVGKDTLVGFGNIFGLCKRLRNKKHASVFQFCGQQHMYNLRCWCAMEQLPSNTVWIFTVPVHSVDIHSACTTHVFQKSAP